MERSSYLQLSDYEWIQLKYVTVKALDFPTGSLTGVTSQWTGNLEF